MDEIIVFALFQSNSKFPDIPGVKVFSFGIGSGTHHISLDLSTYECIAELEKYPNPEVIIAHPPCESWVRVSIGNVSKFTKDSGLNLHWRNKWTPFDFTAQLKKTRENGCNTAMMTAKIIQHFKPYLWCIENGASSLIFSYMNKHFGLSGILNKCNYVSYGASVKKPTIIYSNKSLMLRNFNKPNSDIVCWVRGSRRKEQHSSLRSHVPSGLHIDILRQYKTMFRKRLPPETA